MTEEEPGAAGEDVPVDDAGPADDPALRDAANVVARAEADEVAAADARRRIAANGLPQVVPDEAISDELRPGEQVHAVRTGAILNAPDPDHPLPGLGGALYLTSSRLIHRGQVIVSVPLEEIEELSLAGERLLLTLGTAEGLSLDVAGPRLLRVEIGAARAALRLRRVQAP